MSEKKEWYEWLSHEIINMLIAAGLSLILIFMGIDYFALESSWTKVAAAASAQSGVSDPSLANELNMMYSRVSSSFPFNFLLKPESFNHILILGLVLLIIGLIIKIVITPQKREFYNELSTELIIPGIIGIFSAVLMQMISIFMVTGIARKQNLADLLTALSQLKIFESGISVWGAYSDIFIVALYAIVIGGILLTFLKARKLKIPFLKWLGKTSLNSGIFCLIYYVLLRAIASDFIAGTPLGPFLGIFAVTSQMSNLSFVTSVFIVIAGMEMKKYSMSIYPHEPLIKWKKTPAA